MTALWLGIIIVGGLAATFALTSWRRRTDKTELGTISDQWLSEQRGNSRHHSQQ